MKAVVGIVVVIIVIIGGVIFFAGDSNAPQGENGEGQITQKDALPQAILQDANGATVELSNVVAGTPAVINSWATWCPFCIDELPDFAELQTKYDGQIQVIAINRGESVARAEGYLTDLSVEDGMTYLYDDRDVWYRIIGGFSMPETLFVDAGGNIAFHKRGFMTLAEMDSLVQQHLLAP